MPWATCTRQSRWLPQDEPGFVLGLRAHPSLVQGDLAISKRFDKDCCGCSHLRRRVDNWKSVVLAHTGSRDLLEACQKAVRPDVGISKSKAVQQSASRQRTLLPTGPSFKSSEHGLHSAQTTEKLCRYQRAQMPIVQHAWNASICWHSHNLQTEMLKQLSRLQV